MDGRTDGWALRAAGVALWLVGCTPPSVGGLLMSGAVPPSGNVIVAPGEEWQVAEVTGGRAVDPVGSVAPEVTLSCVPAERCDNIYIYDDGRFAIELEGEGPFVLRVHRPGFETVELTIVRDQTYLLVLLPVRAQEEV
jgi:hypothetical protein